MKKINILFIALLLYGGCFLSIVGITLYNKQRIERIKEDLAHQKIELYQCREKLRKCEGGHLKTPGPY